MRLWSLFAVALLIAAPSTLSAQEHVDATAAITAASEAFDAAYNAAISAWFAGGLVEGGPTLDLQTGDVFAIEGAALETGSYVMTGADGSHIDHGNYMVAWSHTEDGWRMARDMWNSNMARD